MLERQWGTFRFNLYFFTGVLLHAVAAIFIYLVWGMVLMMGTYYLNLSMFFAFAALFPNMQVLFMWLIPIKMKMGRIYRCSHSRFEWTGPSDCIFTLGETGTNKEKNANNPKHLILEAPHPSPLSAYRGFLGCKHCSKCNEFLKEHGLQPVDWQIENL